MTEVNKNTGMYPSVKGKKRKVAEAVVDPDDERTITELCKDFKISRTTFYNWKRDSDFMGYVNYLIESFTTSIIPKAWKQISKKIDKGDMEAIKMLLEVKGKLQKDTSINNNVVVFTGENDIPK